LYNAPYSPDGNSGPARVLIVTPAPLNRAITLRQAASDDSPAASEPLCWRVHLAGQHPEKLPGVGATLVAAFAGVWILFGNPIPAIVAVVLLLGATADFLLPISYRISDEGVSADSLTSHLRLTWPNVKRCLVSRNAVLLSPLARPSRLDSFRGVVLRYAPDGCPGDRDSLYRSILAHRPETAPPDRPGAPGKEQA
jgi:hypothetical protein